jgi:hypothetical protein
MVFWRFAAAAAFFTLRLAAALCFALDMNVSLQVSPINPPRCASPQRLGAARLFQVSPF